MRWLCHTFACGDGVDARRRLRLRSRSVFRLLRSLLLLLLGGRALRGRLTLLLCSPRPQPSLASASKPGTALGNRKPTDTRNASERSSREAADDNPEHGHRPRSSSSTTLHLPDVSPSVRTRGRAPSSSASAAAKAACSSRCRAARFSRCASLLLPSESAHIIALSPQAKPLNVHLIYLSQPIDSQSDDGFRIPSRASRATCRSHPPRHSSTLASVRRAPGISAEPHVRRTPTARIAQLPLWTL